MTPEEKLIREAVKLMVWMVGEGLSPIPGEPAEDPEDILMEYSDATGDIEWEILYQRIYPRALAHVEKTNG